MPVLFNHLSFDHWKLLSYQETQVICQKTSVSSPFLNTKRGVENMKQSVVSLMYFVWKCDASLSGVFDTCI